MKLFTSIMAAFVVAIAARSAFGAEKERSVLDVPQLQLDFRGHSPLSDTLSVSGAVRYAGDPAYEPAFVAISSGFRWLYSPNIWIEPRIGLAFISGREDERFALIISAWKGMSFRDDSVAVRIETDHLLFGPSFYSYHGFYSLDGHVLYFLTKDEKILLFAHFFVPERLAEINYDKALNPLALDLGVHVEQMNLLTSFGGHIALTTLHRTWRVELQYSRGFQESNDGHWLRLVLSLDIDP